MAYKTRVNPKTGVTEYKVRYYFMRDNKKRDSETAWFSSLEKAEQEAKKQKEIKEKEDRHRAKQRRDKKLVTAYEEFIDYLQGQADKEITNTDIKELNMARAILNNCCFSHYLQLHVAHYLPPFSKLSQRFQHIIQSQLCILNTVIKKRSTLFNPNEFADCKNIRVFCNV